MSLYAEYNILMSRLGRLYCIRREFDLLASLKKYNLLFTRNDITKQLAFHIISSSPILKNIAQNIKPLVLAESLYLHWLWYSYLGWIDI